MDELTYLDNVFILLGYIGILVSLLLAVGIPMEWLHRWWDKRKP